MEQKSRIKTVVGATALASFPELAKYTAWARVDTGAAISVIHCESIRLFPETNKLEFWLLFNRQCKRFVTDQFKVKRIKNSFGEVESRYIIRTLIILGGRRVRARISLTNRSNMKYTVLIGRNLLQSRFLVDVSLNRVR